MFNVLSENQGENSQQRKHLIVGKQRLIYGEVGLLSFDNFQVTERTRNQFVGNSGTWVRIPPSPPKKLGGARKCAA